MVFRIFFKYFMTWSRNQVGLQAGWPGFNSQQENIFLSSTVSRETQAHPAFYPKGIRGSFPGDRAAGE
jgi:hypothetical protein